MNPQQEIDLRHNIVLGLLVTLPTLSTLRLRDVMQLLKSWFNVNFWLEATPIGAPAFLIAKGIEILVLVSFIGEYNAEVKICFVVIGEH